MNTPVIAPVLRRAVQFVRVAAVLALGFAPAGAAAQTASSAAADARFDEARAFIVQVMEEANLPSVALAVAEKGRIVWAEGFGWADLENRVPATEHTLYSLASISKPITATGLMRLVEQGKVDLDAPVNRYLGRGKLRGLAGGADAATVRRVMSHTAGLPLHWQFFYDGEGWNPPTMDETITRYGILVSAPGEVYSYSNLGYGILDHVIERVSGRRYADYMRTDVFMPLGLGRMSVDLTPELEPHAATRYDGDGLRPVPFYAFDHAGASAVWASAHDLVRFAMFHMGDDLPGQRQILSEKTRRSMWEVQTPEGSGLAYALGWVVDPDNRGHLLVSHSGGMPGVSTHLYLFPEKDVAVAVLLNTRSVALGRIIEKVVDAVLPGYAAARPERTAVDDRKPDLSSLRGTWEGRLHTWQDTVSLRLVVQEDGDVLVAVGGQLETLLNGVSFQAGALRGRYAGEVPTSDARRQRHTVSVDLRQHGDTLRGSASAIDSYHYALTSYIELVRRR